MTNIRGGNQDSAELAQFLDLVRALKVRRYLEIGARNGHSFYEVMRTIGAGGFGLAIDIPENANARDNLLATATELCAAGIVSEVIFGNSRSDEVIRHARARAPFDLILIDADHRYEGVKADVATYFDLAPIIVLHDVAAPPGHLSDGFENGVGMLWNEIKGGFRHQEFVEPGSCMGFGIIHRDAVH